MEHLAEFCFVDVLLGRRLVHRLCRRCRCRCRHPPPRRRVLLRRLPPL